MIGIERLELLHVRMPFRFAFETSFGRSLGHEAVLVRVESQGSVGWGEAPPGSGPFFSHEDVHTAWHVLRDHLAPAVRKARLAGPGDLPPHLAFVRGHPMAKAGLEAALWDLCAKLQGVPLARLYCGSEPPARIPTGISLGIEKTVEDLLARVQEAVERGYRRVKIKIKPGWDVEVISRVRARFPDTPIMADANAAYRLGDADRLKELDGFRLTMIEQPLSHDDLLDHAELQSRLKTPICLDESIRSAEDVRKAALIGACRIVNLKQARVGGYTEARRVHDACLAAGMPVWCGGALGNGDRPPPQHRPGLPPQL